MPGTGRAVYFVNGFVDAALIGGLSIAACAALGGLSAAGHPDPAPTLAFWLGWVCNWPHFAASSYRLYHSRANVAQYPMTALAVPFLIVAAVAGAFLSPDVAAPALVKLYLLWSPFHFSGQSFGVTLLYARRAGVDLGRFGRAAFSGFFYATYASVVLFQETDAATHTFGAVVYPSLGLPAWISQAADVAVGIAGVLVLAAFVRSSIASRRPLPPILLLPALAQFTWFCFGRSLPSFNALVPFFHALQYLLVAWSMQLRERLEQSGAAPGRPFVWRETVRWGLINIAGGIVLFGALPRLAALAGPPLVFCQAVFFAAIQIHHFFVDGVIWKLRHSKVGARLAGTLDDAAAAGAGAP